MLPTVLITEGATAAAILALLPLPIDAALSLLPIIGVALNGTWIRALRHRSRSCDA